MENFRSKEFIETMKTPESEIEELFKQTTAYINAGGRGTRLESVLSKDDKIGITKSLIKFGGKDPIIKYHIERLAKKGFNNIVVNAGDHFNVKEYLDSMETEKLKVITTDAQEGTGGDLIRAVRELPDVGKYILINNSDTLVDIDEGDVLKQHKDSGAEATFVVSRKTKDIPSFYVGKDGKIIFYRKAKSEYSVLEPEKEDIAYPASSTGIVVFNTDLVKNYDWQPSDGQLSIYNQIVAKLIKEGKVFAYDNSKKFFVDIGTPNDYKRVMRHPILKKILETR